MAMIAPPLAEWLVRLAAAYLGLRLLFAVPFSLRWVNQLDDVAAHGTPGFRLLLLPGAMLLWPVLVWRLGDRAPFGSGEAATRARGNPPGDGSAARRLERSGDG